MVIVVLIGAWVLFFIFFVMLAVRAVKNEEKEKENFEELIGVDDGNKILLAQTSVEKKEEK